MIEIESPSQWQLIYMTARVNSREYCGEELPAYNWQWPRSTWFRQRLAEVQAREAQHEKAKIA